MSRLKRYYVDSGLTYTNESTSLLLSILLGLRRAPIPLSLSRSIPFSNGTPNEIMGNTRRIGCSFFLYASNSSTTIQMESGI